MKLFEEIIKEYGLILFIPILIFTVILGLNYSGYFKVEIPVKTQNNSDIRSEQKPKIVSEEEKFQVVSSSPQIEIPEKKESFLQKIPIINNPSDALSLIAITAAVAERPNQSETMKRAEATGDFSNIPHGYNVIKAVKVLGMKGVIAEYSRTGQYMAVIDTGTVLNLTKKDLSSGRTVDKLRNYGERILPPNIKIKKLEITPGGSMNIFNQKVPYGEMRIKLSGINSSRTYVGMIGILSKTETGKNLVIFSMDRTGRFNQKIAENYYKTVKIR